MGVMSVSKAYFVLSAVFFLLTGSVTEVRAGWSVDIEGGAAFNGYNDVRIPGNEGTDLSLSEELKSNEIPMLVIDQDPDSKHALEHHGIPYIIDDATSEDVLIEAGIERAKGLVSVVSSDADNLFITMTARGLNPELFILARADQEHSHNKLSRAGANRVVLPYRIGGLKMAQTIIRPAVTEFLELTVHDRDIELEIEELRVGELSTLNGVSLLKSGIRQEMDVIIVAIRKKDGKMIFNPSSQARIEAGDTLIALGHGNDLERLASVLSGE